MTDYIVPLLLFVTAAVALGKKILAEGEPAVKDYLKFLSAGSSSDPISVLKIAGVDMTTKAPIQAALDVFGELLEEMEELI